eukprot:4908771-Amphidinium_carterae.1
MNLEGIRIQQIATHESHSLFLTSEGHVWSCGSGFAGILGHGDLHNRSVGTSMPQNQEKEN